MDKVNKDHRPLKDRKHHKSLTGHRTINGITTEQEAFCRAMALGMSVPESLAASGISVTEGTARNWIKKDPKISARIDELTSIATKNAILKTGLDRQYVIERLMKVVDRCMQAEPVLDRKGQPTGEYKFDSSGANAALRMLGDTLGMFKPTEAKPGDEYANLSDDDIARIAAELAAQTGLLEAPARVETPQRSQQVIELQAVPEADRVS